MDGHAKSGPRIASCSQPKSFPFTFLRPVSTIIDGNVSDARQLYCTFGRDKIRLGGSSDEQITSRDQCEGWALNSREGGSCNQNLVRDLQQQLQAMDQRISNLAGATEKNRQSVETLGVRAKTAVGERRVLRSDLNGHTHKYSNNGEQDSTGEPEFQRANKAHGKQ